jgi:FkbM family methyltransferase
MLKEERPVQSEAAMPGQPLRISLRNVLSRLLGKIPLRYLERLRLRTVPAPMRSKAFGISSILLKLVRYRQPDSSIDSFVTLDQPGIRIQNTDCVLVRSLYWFGLTNYEDREYEIWKYLCSNAKQGILEIGANIGFYTIVGSKLAGNIPYTAVEPHPVTFSILQRNLALNLIENVKLCDVAVVGHKTAETMSLMVPIMNGSDDAPAGSFLEFGGERQIAAHRSYRVSLIEAETLFKGIDLIKMDVEGYEFEILSSVRPYLEKQHPVLLLEVLRKSEKLRSFIGTFCQEQQYSVSVFNNKSLVQIPLTDVIGHRFKDKYKTRDLILTPPGYPLPQIRF